MMPRRTLLGLPALALLASCQMGRTEPRGVASQPAPALAVEKAATAKAPSMDDALLERLAILAAGSTSPASKSRASEVKNQRVSIQHYIDELVESDAFARDVAPEMLLHEYLVPSNNILFPRVLASASLGKGKGDVYYLNKLSPCTEAESELVKPWWDTSSPIRICKESYRPNVLERENSGFWCGGAVRDTDMSRPCGCGPNLVNCFRDREHLKEVTQSMVSEVRDTIAHVVRRDAPVEAIYQTKETVRSKGSEFQYRRWRLLNGDKNALAGLDAWPGEGKLAPRTEMTPGQHAGILTTQLLAWFGDSSRGRIKYYTDMLWCSSANSTGVTAEAMLNLHAVDLRQSEGWEKLALTPVCNACHASLDYGQQFFGATPSVGFASVYNVNAYILPTGAPTRPLSQKEGLFYVHGLDDLRGRTANVTPAGWVEMALKQPEFESCLTGRVASHVFNSGASADDLKSISEAFRASHSLKKMLAVALNRYAARVPATARTSEVAGANVTPPATTSVAVPEKLHGMIVGKCGGCHSDGGDQRVLTGKTLTRATLEDMLVQVAFGNMPKTGFNVVGLKSPERRELVNEMLGVLWVDPATRTVARSYYEGGLRAQPVIPSKAALNLVRNTAEAARSAPFTVLETTLPEDLVQYTPGFSVTMSLAALNACKSRGLSGDALRTCTKHSSNPELFTSDR